MRTNDGRALFTGRKDCGGWNRWNCWYEHFSAGRTGDESISRITSVLGPLATLVNEAIGLVIDAARSSWGKVKKKNLGHFHPIHRQEVRMSGWDGGSFQWPQVASSLSVFEYFNDWVVLEKWFGGSRGFSHKIISFQSIAFTLV